MARQKKTPRQRAEEQLAVADRKVTRLRKERDKHQGELNRIVSELEAETARRDYLAQHPDLKQPSTTNPTGDTA